MLISLLVMGFFVSLAAGMVIAVWLQRGSGPRASRQGEFGCMSLVFGVSIFLCLMLIVFAVAIITDWF